MAIFALVLVVLAIIMAIGSTERGSPLWISVILVEVAFIAFLLMVLFARFGQLWRG